MKRTRVALILGIYLAVALFITPLLAPAKSPAVTWRMQSIFPPPEELFSGAGVLGVYGQWKELARRVEKRTNGGFKIKVFLPNELCKKNECPEALMAGMIDALGGNGMYWTGIWPEGFISGNIPYSTKTYEKFENIYRNTEYIKLLRRGHAKKNVYWLCNTESASSNLMTTFPIRSVADIKGKKIAASGPRADLIKAMGGAPVNVSSAEMYTALQRGLVEGITYPPYCGISYKFFEVVDYVIWPGITVPSMGEILVNLESWNKLPEEYKNIINEEAFSMFVDEALPEWGPKKDKLAQEGAEKYGVKNIWLADKAYEEMREYAMPLWDKWAKLSPENAELIEIFSKALGKK
jgi:TRAP-type C4-dicarboxylate transport system substrate-binding protein